MKKVLASFNRVRHNHTDKMTKIQEFINSKQLISPQASLRRRWLWTAAVFGLTLGGGYGLLPPEWHQAGYARQWAMQTAIILAYLLLVFYRGLADNYRRGETRLLPMLGPGNMLTLWRGAAIGWLAGFLFLPRPAIGWLAWEPAALYTFISILDYLDGYVARVANHATKLGEILDGVCDALGLLVAVGLLVWYGQLPGWYLLVGLARYLFVWGLWWRQRRGQPVFDLPPSTRRRLAAGIQMGYISVMLWPMFSPPATTLAGVIFATPLLTGFGRDWLVVSGHLDPASTRYRRFRTWLLNLMEGWLPPLLRAGVGLLSLWYLYPIALHPAARSVLFLWPGSPWPALTTALIALLAIAAPLLVGVGSLTRLAALGLLVPVAMTLVAVGLNYFNTPLLLGVILLMLLGGGKWSLWRLDDRFVTVRAGGVR